jgi:hypothetical protein
MRFSTGSQDKYGNPDNEKWFGDFHSGKKKEPLYARRIAKTKKKQKKSQQSIGMPGFLARVQWNQGTFPLAPGERC